MPELQFDPASPDFIADPYPVYDRMRADTPILYHPESGMWFLTAYEDIYTLLRDRRLGRSIADAASPEAARQSPEGVDLTPFNHFTAHSFIDLEPPAHTRLRSLVNKAFTPRRVEGLRGRIQSVADGLLDRVQPLGRFDLLADFAVPLSVSIIAELLGVPEGDRDKLRPWSHAIVAMYELSHTDEQARRAVQAVEEFTAYLEHLAAQRRADPQDDLITALVQVEDGGQRLSLDELTATCILLLNAGHEATVHVLGNGLLALLRHPLQLQALRQNPALAVEAIEEMMRYDTPLPMFRRWVLEDMDYKGHHFQRGAELALVYGAGNRDPARFVEANSFDIARRDNSHLSLGGGIHYCLGAPLARLELQIAVNTLLGRLPNLRLSGPEPERQPTYIFRALKSLQLEFT